MPPIPGIRILYGAEKTILKHVSGVYLSIQFLPNNPTGNRGLKGHLVVAEEAGFIHEKLWKNTILPLTTERGTAMACISSPDDKNSTFGRMATTTDDDGKPLFKVITMEQMGGLVTSHKTHSRIEQLKKLYEDDMDRYNREMKGEFGGDSNYVFDERYVELLFEGDDNIYRDSEHGSYRPSEVFVCVDPSGGGSESDMGIASGFFDQRGRLVIVGLDAIMMAANNPDEIQAQAMCAHLEKLSKIPILSRARVVLGVEGNLSKTQASGIAHVAESLMASRIHVLRAYKKDRRAIGFNTTNELKETTALDFGDMLRHGRVCFHEHWFTGSDDGKTSQAMIIKKLRKQLLCYQRIVGDKIVKYTGKPNDDLCVVVQFLLALQRLYHQVNQRFFEGS